MASVFDRPGRPALAWAAVAGAGVLLGALVLAYDAGVHASPTSCQQVANLASAMQGFDLELDSLTQSALELRRVLDWDRQMRPTGGRR